MLKYLLLMSVNLINSNDEDVEFIVKFQKEMRKQGVIFATQSPQELIPENINAKVEPKQVLH